MDYKQAEQTMVMTRWGGRHPTRDLTLILSPLDAVLPCIVLRISNWYLSVTLVIAKKVWIQRVLALATQNHLELSTTILVMLRTHLAERADSAELARVKAQTYFERDVVTLRFQKNSRRSWCSEYTARGMCFVKRNRRINEMVLTH